MEDSYIHHGRGGTMFAGPDAVALVRVTALWSGIGLLQHGILPSRGWSMTKALKWAGVVTGKTYKRTQANEARGDLQIWIAEMRDALPHTEDHDAR